MLLPVKFAAGFKKEKRVKSRRIDSDSIGVDVVAKQVKKLLTTANQQLILMVRD